MNKYYALPEKLSSLSWEIIHLALPMIAVLLVGVSCTFSNIDTLSDLGIEMLAASAIVFVIQGFLIGIGRALLRSLSILLNLAIGVNDEMAIGGYLQQAWLLSVLMSVPIIVIYWQIVPILLFFDQPPLVGPIAASYFHIAAFAIIPNFFLVCYQQLGNSLRCNKFVLLSSLVSAALFLAASYALILGKWGLPELGFAGLAYAVILQNVIGLALLMGYFYFNKDFHELQLWSYRGFCDGRKLKQLFTLGWPISLQASIEVFVLMAIALFAGWISITSLAAYQVVDQYLYILLVPTLGLAQASALLIGQAYGQQCIGSIKKIALVTLAIALVFSGIMSAVLWSEPRFLVSAFIDINDPAETGVLLTVLKLFGLLAFLIVLSSINNILMNLLRALFDTHYPLLISLLCLLVIGLPLSYYLAFDRHMDLLGIYSGYFIGILLSSLLLFKRWHMKINALDFPSP